MIFSPTLAIDKSHCLNDMLTFSCKCIPFAVRETPTYFTELQPTQNDGGGIEYLAKVTTTHAYRHTWTHTTTDQSTVQWVFFSHFSLFFVITYKWTANCDANFLPNRWRKRKKIARTAGIVRLQFSLHFALFKSTHQLSGLEWNKWLGSRNALREERWNWIEIAEQIITWQRPHLASSASRVQSNWMTHFKDCRMASQCNCRSPSWNNPTGAMDTREILNRIEERRKRIVEESIFNRFFSVCRHTSFQIVSSKCDFALSTPQLRRPFCVKITGCIYDSTLLDKNSILF